LADLPGNKIRLGKFPSHRYPVEQGQEILFQSGESSPNPAEFIPINLGHVGKYVTLNEEISFGDGEIGFKVTDIINEDSFKAEALNARELFAEKGVNLGQKVDEVDHLTANTVLHIKNLKNIRPDWVAFSFVNSRENLKVMKDLLEEHYPGHTARIVAKVESPLGVHNINEIIEETDVVMIARGDLGLTVPYEQLGILQKKIIQKTKEKGKEIIVATQILDSLMSSYIPSRAEVADLTSIVLEGADGIMMAKETGMSATPGHSVAVAKRVIDYVEKEKGASLDY
jgi:pyruvate kinase